MSPTRRDLIKSAAAISALLGTARVSGAIATDPVAPVATGAHPAEQECRPFRKAEIFGVIRDTETGHRNVCTLFLDGDLDGTWTVAVAPNWRRDVLTDDDDATGYHVTRDHSADTLLDAVWDSLLAPAPRILAATPFHAFDDLWDHQHAAWHDQWSRRTAEGTWMEPYGWQDADALNATDWGLVTTRTAIMAGYPGYDAIVMCLGRFSLAVLEGGVS